MMLEESLQSSTYSPSDAARGVLSYLRHELPSGPDAEYRFCSILYPLLVGRIFGALQDEHDDNENNSDDADSNNNSKKKECMPEYRHASGGWLCRHLRWTTFPVSAHTTSAAAAALEKASMMEADPVVRLLSPRLPCSKSVGRGGVVGRRVRGGVTTGGGGRSMSRRSSSTLEGGVTLMEAIALDRPGVHLSFPLFALGVDSREVLLRLVHSLPLGESSVSSLSSSLSSRLSPREAMLAGNGSINRGQLWSRVLCTPPSGQAGVARYVQFLALRQQHLGQMALTGSRLSSPHQQQLQLGAYYGQPSPQQQSHSSPSPVKGGADSNVTSFAALRKVASETMVLLTMWEYYFMVFLRYPFAKPTCNSNSNNNNNNNDGKRTISHASQHVRRAASFASPSTYTSDTSHSNSSSSSSSSIPYGDQVYEFLFQSYVQHYLQHRRVASARTSSAGAAFDGGSLDSLSWQDMTLGEMVQWWIDYARMVYQLGLDIWMHYGQPCVLFFWKHGLALATSFGIFSGDINASPAAATGQQSTTTTAPGVSLLSRSSPPTPPPAPVPLHREAEAFLRICIEFWLQSSNVAQSPYPHITSPPWRQKQRVSPRVFSPTSPHGAQHVPLQPQGLSKDDKEMTLPSMQQCPSCGLACAYNQSTVQSNGGRYTPTPPLVTSGLRYLVGHVVSDPAVEDAVLHWSWKHSYGIYASAASGEEGNAGVRASTDSRLSSNILSKQSQNDDQGFLGCLTPAMKTMQQSLLDFIRLALRYAPIHLPDSPFYTALDVWLLWVEPWNYATSRTSKVATSVKSSFSWPRKKRKSSGSSSSNSRRARSHFPPGILPPKPDAPSKYTAQWEPYVVANLHLYVIPLAVFLRRSKELDFGSRFFRGSLNLVRRVMRVFAPEVVDVIQKALLVPSASSFSSLLATSSQGGASVGGGLDSSGGTTSVQPESTWTTSPQVREQLQQLRTQHEINLATSRPVCDPHSLSTLSQDIHQLMEEVYFQHDRKLRNMDIIDHMEERFNDFFWGTGVKGMRRAVDDLKGKARVLMGLPPEEEGEGAYYGLDGGLSQSWIAYLLSWLYWFVGMSTSYGRSDGRGNYGRPHESEGSSNTTSSTSTSQNQPIQAKGSSALPAPPERLQDGHLTLRGKEELIRGQCIFSPNDVHFVGDPMYARVRSYEIALLVKICNAVSARLNQHLGLGDEEVEVSCMNKNGSNQGFRAALFKIVWVVVRLSNMIQSYKGGTTKEVMRVRVNLRFFADYRNLVFFAMLWIIFKFLRFVFFF